MRDNPHGPTHLTLYLCVHSSNGMELVNGVEPLTYALRMRCSTS